MRSDRAESVVLTLAGLRRAGLANLAPRDWLTGNRILFEAKSGDSSHVFEIGLSPPSWIASAWRLDASPRRLTFGTAQDERPAVSSLASPAGLRRLAFASVSRKENVWSVALDTNRPGSGSTLTQLTHGTDVTCLSICFRGRHEADVHLSRRVQRSGLAPRCEDRKNICALDNRLHQVQGTHSSGWIGGLLRRHGNRIGLRCPCVRRAS